MPLGLLLLGCAPDFGEETDDDAGTESSGSSSTTTGAATSQTATSGTGTSTSTGSSTAVDPSEDSTTALATTTTATDGPETTSSTTSSTATGSSSSSDGLDCEPDEVCVAAVPDGWDGPFALRTADSPAPDPDCGGDYSISEDAFGQVLVPGEHTCGCECGAATGSSCTNSTVLTNGSNNAQCIFDLNEWTISGSCDNDPSAVGGGFWSAEPFTVTGGSCAPNPSMMVGAASYSTRGVLCSEPPLPTASCGERGSCAAVPNLPFESGLCIVADGDLECPAEFPGKELFYDGITDNRSCSECTCGSPFGSCTGFSVRLFNQASCGGSPLATISASGVCTEVFSNQGVESASIQTGTLGSASCNSAGGVEVGGAIASGARTVCCGEFSPA